jgi:hypothetical protein
VFRRRPRRKNSRPSPEASLAQAEAARRTEECKRAEERPVMARLDRLIEENHLAEQLRRALSGRGPS